MSNQNAKPIKAANNGSVLKQLAKSGNIYLNV